MLDPMRGLRVITNTTTGTPPRTWHRSLESHVLGNQSAWFRGRPPLEKGLRSRNLAARSTLFSPPRNHL
jgi:hypothetical protein